MGDERREDDDDEWQRRLDRRRSLIRELLAANGMDPAGQVPEGHHLVGMTLAPDPTAPAGHLWWDEVVALVPDGDGPVTTVEELRRHPHVVVPSGLKITIDGWPVVEAPPADPTVHGGQSDQAAFKV